MVIYRRTALWVLAAFALAGCSSVPLTQPLSPKVAAAIQPVEVKIGIAQPELYAAFEQSRAGSSAAAACGAVPGLGILLAAACGAAAGAVDASVNASRAKTADEAVRPLKDEIVDLNFDRLMNESVTQSLQGVPGMRLSSIAVTKAVKDKDYEESFRASTSSAVMFVNVDYHLSIDFSTLEISARGLVYPRSTAARVAAGLPEALPGSPETATSTTSSTAGAGTPGAHAGDALLALKNAAYRTSVFYHAKLPNPADDPAAYIAAWKADGGKLLRAAIQDGGARVSRLLAEDLQRTPDAKRVVLSQVALEQKGKNADVLSDNNGVQLLRYPDGSLHIKTTATTAATGTAPISANAASL